MLALALVGIGSLVGLTATGSTLIALIGGAIALATGLGGIAGFHAYKSAASGWREERDAAVAKADRMEEEKEQMVGEIKELNRKMAELRTEVDRLREKDVSKVYDLLTIHHEEVMRRLQQDATAARDSTKEVVDSLLEAVKNLTNNGVSPT